MMAEAQPSLSPFLRGQMELAPLPALSQILS
jgi:hypothetical protein